MDGRRAATTRRRTLSSGEIRRMARAGAAKPPPGASKTPYTGARFRRSLVTPLMGWLLAVLVLALVAAILPAQRRAYVLQYLFFCRFAVTVGALLVVLPLLALGPGKSFLGNLLALDGAGV